MARNSLCFVLVETQRIQPADEPARRRTNRRRMVDQRTDFTWKSAGGPRVDGRMVQKSARALRPAYPRYGL